MNGLCRVFTSSRVLSSNVTLLLSQIPNKTKKPLLANRRLSQFVSVRAMASEKQKQHAQPGKEHVMETAPQFSSSDYQPSNKLRVIIFITYSFEIKIITYS